jgi:putative phage-type endonuclease
MITATDAAAIMGMNPWKTPLKLFKEKGEDILSPTLMSPAMQRGIDLEPLARDYFTMMTGIKLIPKEDARNVVIHPQNQWMMASFDGVSECGEVTIEIKCPGLNSEDHALAARREISGLYIPQNQHQMECKRPRVHFYMVFDGFTGQYFEVKKDEAFCKKMLAAELEFYTLLNNKTPPEPTDGDYNETQDTIWLHIAEKIRRRRELYKELEREDEEDKNTLISIGGGSNTRGGGISLCQISRKGNVDYAKIPALKGVDLEQYRKQSSTSWRINVA